MVPAVGRSPSAGERSRARSEHLARASRPTASDRSEESKPRAKIGRADPWAGGSRQLPAIQRDFGAARRRVFPRGWSRGWSPSLHRPRICKRLLTAVYTSRANESLLHVDAERSDFDDSRLKTPSGDRIAQHERSFSVSFNLTCRQGYLHSILAAALSVAVFLM